MVVVVVLDCARLLVAGFWCLSLVMTMAEDELELCDKKVL